MEGVDCVDKPPILHSLCRHPPEERKEDERKWEEQQKNKGLSSEMMNDVLGILVGV